MREEPLQTNMREIPPDQWGPGYRIWRSFADLLAQRGPEGTTSLVRMASHFVVLLVAVVVLWLGRVQLPKWDIAFVSRSATTQTQNAPNDLIVPRASGATSSALVRAAVPITLVQERPRLDVITHTVAAGDTLYDIAARYGISAETLMWSNNMEMNPDLLRLGQMLTVLPVDGVYHTVESGDTVESIAKKYKTTPEGIVSFEANHLDPQNPALTAGQKLIVPGGSKPQVVRQVAVFTGTVPPGASTGTGRFVWPTAGSITQGFKPLHQAIDIAAPLGTQVKASDSGYIVEAGWSSVGYGNYIVIDHGNGYQTLYGHLSRILVQGGESVGQGAVIGLMGTSGISTGSHLHFEIREYGVKRNPFGFLP